MSRPFIRDMVCASEGSKPNDTDHSPLKTMQFKSFFPSKVSQETKSFLSYEGPSKDPVIGASKVNNKLPNDPEEYPMGEWGPTEPEEYPMGEWGPADPQEFPMSEWSPWLLDPMQQSMILTQNTSPTSDELCTTFF